MYTLLFSIPEIFPERTRSIAPLYGEELLTWACEDEISSSIATFDTDVDDGISIGDDIEIVLDDEDTIALLDERIEDVEEFLYV